VGCVHVHCTLDERDGRLLYQEMLLPDLGFHDGQGLSEGVAGVPGRCLRPQQVGQVVAAEAASALNPEPDQKREMLPSPEPDGLAFTGGQERRPECRQQEMRSQGIISQCFGLALLGRRINPVSTTAGTVC
jgi:hypothetical protein